MEGLYAEQNDACEQVTATFPPHHRRVAMATSTTAPCQSLVTSYSTIDCSHGNDGHVAATTPRPPHPSAATQVGDRKGIRLAGCDAIHLATPTRRRHHPPCRVTSTSTPTSSPVSGTPGRRGYNTLRVCLPAPGVALLLVALVVLVALTPPCLAEVLFHRRDHRDQGEQFPRQNIYTVKTYEDAMQYLNKYGYLNCTASRLKRDLDFEEFAEEGTAQRQVCSEEEVKGALKQLQSKFKLSQTGVLDDATKLTMSKGRCGNADKDPSSGALLPARPPTQVPPNPMLYGPGDKPGGPAGPPARAPAGSRPAVGPPGARSPTRVRRRALDIIDRNQELARERERSQQRARQSAAFWGDGRGLLSRILSPDLQPPRFEEHDMGARRRRRQDMLLDLITRIRSEQQEEEEGEAGRDALAAADPEAPGTPGAPGAREGRRNATSAREWTRFGQKYAASQQRSPRARRSVAAADSGTGTRFAIEPGEALRWRLLSSALSGKIPLSDQRAILMLAFRMWGEVIPLGFNENGDESIDEINILVAFGKHWHLNCEKPFDGQGGELAHSQEQGDIHFDEDENYKGHDPTGTGINLLKVAVHEIGHVLGLGHTNNTSSIMYPLYHEPAMYTDFELVREDRDAIQQLYGVCKGSFSVAFDWLRKVPDRYTLYPKYIYNTYFFRNDRYWMYENRYNRTRYGDPLLIHQEWYGLPGNMDAYIQVVNRVSIYEFDIQTYFFKDDLYYKYNDNDDAVAIGYPRRISEDFGSSNGSESIPDNVDSAYFDARDNSIYFFKGEWVWKYPSWGMGQNVCCDEKYRFRDLFPMVDNSTEPLLGNVDSVYHSYHHVATYFFKDENVYINDALGEGPGHNVLRNLGPWYQIWHDVCDVL